MPPPQPSPAIRIAGEGGRLPPSTSECLSLLSGGEGLGWGPMSHNRVSPMVMSIDSRDVDGMLPV